MSDPSFDELRRLFQLSRAFMCVASLDGYFKRLNPAWLRLGYSLEELYSRPFLEFVHPDDRTRTRHELEARLGRGDETIEFENRYVARDGSVVSLRWDAVADVERAIVYAVAFDVTEQRLMTSELGRARDAAVASARQSSRFLATVSHEVRTPLTSVLGLADLLLDSPMTEAQRTDVAIIHASAVRLTRLFSDIIDYSELERQIRQLVPQPLEVRALLGEVAAEHRERALANGLTLRYVAEDSVPTWVNADRWALQRLLGALLDNSVKFTPRGDITLAARWRGSEGGPRLELIVADTGIGFGRVDPNELMQPLRQADDSDRRAYGGLGLGLAIAKLLVEQMDGQLEIQSTRGDGTQVTVRLPVEPARPVSEVRPAEARAPERTGEHRSISVLVVEDNPINQRVALRLLEERGFWGEVAHDGSEALMRLAERNYDVVLMDAQMPGMDGYTATREIRSRETSGQRLPIIGLTADAVSDSRARCLAAGMDDYLTKPIDAERLFTLIVQHTGLDADEPPVNTERLREASDGERDFETKLAALFVADVERHLSGLREAALKGEAERVKERAHSIKGASAHVGAIGLSRLALELERVAGRGDVDALPAIVARLASEFERARGFLGTYVDGEDEGD